MSRHIPLLNSENSMEVSGNSLETSITSVSHIEKVIAIKCILPLGPVPALSVPLPDFLRFFLSYSDVPHTILGPICQNPISPFIQELSDLDQEQIDLVRMSFAKYNPETQLNIQTLDNESLAFSLSFSADHSVLNIEREGIGFKDGDYFWIELSDLQKVMRKILISYPYSEQSKDIRDLFEDIRNYF